MGDTFATIARRVYGVDSAAGSIARANPGVAEPLTTGISVTVPDLPGTPPDKPQRGQAANANEVAILIDGRRFRFWDSVRISRAIDRIDLVEFGAPFTADIPAFRDAFRPFTYKNITVTVGGETLFTGTMVGVSPVLENGRRLVSVSGYSKPGVLSDCTPPASLYAEGLSKLEFEGQGLREIAGTLAAAFGVGVSFTAEQGATFERVACEYDKRVWSFLVGLAKQRSIVMSSTPDGRALFQQSVEPGNPVTRLAQGSAPLLSVTPFFSPQEYYSHITGLNTVLVGSEGSQFTVKNPLLLGAVRPMTFRTPDTQGGGVKQAVEAKAGRMFGSMAAYSVKLATWRDSNGSLWAPNTSIVVNAPDAMIYEDYEFIIRSVEFERDRSKETATLNLVIPGSFSGKIPEALPWAG